MSGKKKIIVFGAAGFIGTYLIDELASQGCEIIASDISKFGEEHYHHKDVPYVSLDIRDKKNFEKLSKEKAFDAVIHLAALQPATFDKAKCAPSDYIDVNVTGTLNILEFCRKNKAQKIIYGCSHRNTAGLWDQQRPIQEKDGRALQYGGEYSMFSISESIAQDCVEVYGREYDFQGIVFRLPPVYGYGPHLEIFKEGKPVKTGFQTFIENASAGKPLEIWGNPNVGRDIIYVKDVVDAFVKAIDSPKAFGLYNITSNYSLTLQEEVETIANVFWKGSSKPLLIHKPEKTHTMDSFVYDNSKAKRELGWSPKYNFEQMLLDYKKERDSGKFDYLLEKRKKMFKEE